MASELRVDTLKDASGNNSIGLSYVAEGSAKAWGMFVGASLTSGSDLTGVSDSFNLTSVVDNGTGDHTFTVTNGFSTVNYALVTGRQQQSSGFGGHIDIEHGTSPTTSSVEIQTREHYSVQDNPRGSLAFFGDLA